MEFGSTDILLCILILCIGVPLAILTYKISKRLKEIRNSNNVIEGELFVSDAGDIYSEFGIPVPELVKRDTILLKVHHVRPKNKKED